MSEYKTILEKIKKTLNFSEDVVSKFEDVVLSDESVINVEPSVEVGASVMIKGADEAMEIVPDGVYELADNRKIEVIEGKIVSIKEVNNEEEKEVEEEVAEAMSKEEIKALIAEVKSMFSENLKSIENKVSSVEAGFDAKLTNTVNAVIEAFEELGKSPNEETPKKKSGFKIEKKKNIFHK